MFLLQEIEKLDSILRELVPPPPAEDLVNEDDDDNENGTGRRYLLKDLDKVRSLLSDCWTCTCADVCKIFNLKLADLVPSNEHNSTSKRTYEFVFCGGQEYPNCRWQEASIACQPQP